jgi:gliding motility-associated-like protein
MISDSALVTVTPMPWNIDETGSQNTDCGINNGAVYVTMTGTFNDPPSYTWNGPGANNPNEVDASVWTNLSSGWYYVEIESDGCYRYDSAYVDVNNPPVAVLNANPTSGYNPLTVNFTNSSTNSNDFDWNFGNGNTTSTTDLSGQTQTYTSAGTYVAYLVANQGNCSDTAFVTITVTDPPIVIPPVIVPVDLSYPNVFTPNGDQVNDYFEFDLLNIKAIHIDVLNRWGDVVFSSDDINFKWDGKIGNVMATEGVYTFRYEATGAQEEKLEGHGFVHLYY